MANNLTKKNSQAVRQGFTANYFEALQAAFAEHGAKAIETCAKEEPSKFLDVCSRHIPRDVTVSLEQRSNLSHVELDILRGIAASFPNADNMAPGEVLATVAEAIKIHLAKPVTESEK